jgi:DNA-binding response OmpR family regulator
MVMSGDAATRGRDVQYAFEDYVIDSDRRELTRSAEPIAVGPQVFDLLLRLVRNREHVVSKDELLDIVWAGRIVSESTLTSHINAGTQGHQRQRAEPAPASNDRPQGIPVRR